ncbi:MAG: hypothetical protein KatS3mg003_1508 [Candidatus Nitrosocaldaceae archaeon]|nr:MAG: hypothetical protein KatS3mg003_1508 [Candidatus Nitrosocaldaceae archaeon]
MLYRTIIGITILATMLMTIIPKSYAVDPLELSATSIPLGSTIDITFNNIYGNDLPIVAIVVHEPDGDVCRHIENNVMDGVSFTLTYPTNFSPDVGSVDCDTDDIGEYEVKSLAGNINAPPLKFVTSFFALPESPIGAIIIVGSSIAIISSYTLLRKK